MIKQTYLLLTTNKQKTYLRQLRTGFKKTFQGTFRNHRLNPLGLLEILVKLNVTDIQ